MPGSPQPKTLCAIIWHSRSRSVLDGARLAAAWVGDLTCLPEQGLSPQNDRGEGGAIRRRGWEVLRFPQFKWGSDRACRGLRGASRAFVRVSERSPLEKWGNDRAGLAKLGMSLWSPPKKWGVRRISQSSDSAALRHPLFWWGDGRTRSCFVETAPENPRKKRGVVRPKRGPGWGVPYAAGLAWRVARRIRVGVGLNRLLLQPMKRQDYYPPTVPEQALWLRSFARELPRVAETVKLQPQDVTEAVADARWVAYVVGPWRAALRNFSPAATSAIEHSMTGSGDSAQVLPSWHPPAPEPGVVPVKPGALKRIFRMVQRVKYAQGYTEAHGRQLGILTRADTAEHPRPTYKIKLKHGAQNDHAVIRYSRHGRDGILIQSRCGGGGWEDLAVCTGSVYEDKRPLLTPGQPELRDYRLCYWGSGVPFGEWTDVTTVNVGP